MTETKMTRRELATMAAGAAAFSALAADPALAAQPNMQKALDHLRSALVYMDRAKTNKGGHLKKAKELTQAAVVQINKGIDFAS